MLIIKIIFGFFCAILYALGTIKMWKHYDQSTVYGKFNQCVNDLTLLVFSGHRNDIHRVWRRQDRENSRMDSHQDWGLYRRGSFGFCRRPNQLSFSARDCQGNRALTGVWLGKAGVICRFVLLEGLLWPFSMAMVCGFAAASHGWPRMGRVLWPRG